MYDAEKRRRIAEMARLKALEMPAGRQGARANKYLSRDGFAPGGGGGGRAGAEGTLETSGRSERCRWLDRRRGRVREPWGRVEEESSAADGPDEPSGAELLSKREKEVCVNCRLLPVHYLSIKEALMRASAEGETLKRADVRHMFRIEPVKAIRVFELLLANGWIKTADAGKDAAAKGDAGDGDD